MLPPGILFNAVLSVKADEKFKQLCREPHPYFASLPSFVVDIQGSRYDLGPAHMFHRQVEVDDTENVLATVRSGKAEDMPIKVKPLGEELIQVWLDSQLDPMPQTPDYRAWNLSGFENGVFRSGH